LKRSEYEELVGLVVEEETSRLTEELRAIGTARAEDLLGVGIAQIPVTCARVTTKVLREAGLLVYDPE